MIEHLTLLWNLLTGRLECSVCGGLRGASHCNGCHNAPKFCVCDVVDLVPADCSVCGFPIDFCDCSPAERIPHDLSDYDDYIAADMKKCRNCGMKTAFLAGDVYVVRHLYDRPRDPMCVACQALLSEPVAR